MDMNPASKWDLKKTEKALTTTDPFIRLKQLKKFLLGVQVAGHKDARRGIIQNEDSRNTLLIEGYGLKYCMTTDGVNGLHTSTNSVMETRAVLGIEAARATIIREISEVMRDLNIDVRHIQLLADVMTYKGEVLGITRFGLAKTRDSILQLASFERGPEHLFQAGAAAMSDPINGLSECIIMGKPVKVGTGVIGVLRRIDAPVGGRKTVFEDAWNDVQCTR